jgi:hypothetical protein
MRSKHAWLTWACVFVGGAGSLIAADPPSTQELVQGILARSEQVRSGEIHYVRRAGFGTKAIDGGETECHVLFSVGSSKLRTAIDMSKLPVAPPRDAKDKTIPTIFKGTFVEIELAHRGRFVDYRQTPQPDGSTRCAATITSQKRTDDGLHSPPLFAGTMWFDCTRNFVRANAAAAKTTRTAVVSGVRTQVLEWDVAGREFSPFHSVNELTNRGGTLRLYVARELGYTLPLVEYVGVDGTVATAFTSSNFETYGGVDFPRRCVMQYFTKKGAGFYLSYDIVTVKRANQPIADSEFTIPVARGTFVDDQRDLKARSLFTVKDAIPADLNDVISVSENNKGDAHPSHVKPN